MGLSCFALQVCNFSFQGKKKSLKNALGRLSYCSCKVLVLRWQPSLGLDLPGVWGCSAAIPDTLLPFYAWTELGILGERFTVGLLGERFVICHHAPHPSWLQLEWFQGQGGISCSDFSFFLISQSPSPASLLRTPPPTPIFLEMNQLGNAWASVSGMILAYVGRAVPFADSPGISPISLRCGLVRGKQSLNYLLGAYKTL